MGFFSEVNVLRKQIRADRQAAQLTLARAAVNTSFRAVLAYRIHSFTYRYVSKALGYLLYQNSIRKYGVDIAPTADIGPGLVISHVGSIVVGRNARLGARVTLNSGVTLGMRNLCDPSMPRCGDDVDIGAGAKLLGGIIIGSRARIGANAVVITDVPPNALAVGVPARIIEAPPHL